MEPLAGRPVSRRIFEDGIRWVEAIEDERADRLQFVSWLICSPEHQDAFFQAWVIWHDLRALSVEQRKVIEVIGDCLRIR